jgi:putative membrane protein
MSMYRSHPMRWALIGFGALILVIGSLLFVASFLRFGLFYRYSYGMPMMGLGGFGLGLIGVVFLCILVSMAIRFAVWGSMGHRSGYRWNGADAEEILRQRYARGEITKEQFDQMLHDLREEKK